MSKRIEFVKRKNLEENLKKYNAFSVYGYYPLFSDAQTAKIVSPLISYHIHEFEGVEYYMPDGLEMGKTQFHGNWKPEVLKGRECGIFINNSHNVDYYQDVSAVLSSNFSTMLVPHNTTWPISLWGPNDSVIGQPIEIANYGNKIWLSINYNVGSGSPLPGYGDQRGFLELDFDSTTLSVSFSRVIPWAIQSSNIEWIGAGTSINADTIVWSVKYLSGHPNYSGDNTDLIKYDISGSTAIETILFTTPLNRRIIDSQYIPFSDTYVVIEYDGTTSSGLKFICHYTSTGSLIACSTPGSHWMPSIFCHNGNIYVVKFGETHIVDLATMSTSLAGSFSGQAGDASSNPECCNKPTPTSWDCVQKGDHPKFGFKCTEILGSSGQYSTKQECIDSGCEGINPKIGPTIGNVIPPIITTPSQPMQPRLGDPEGEIEELPIIPSVTRTGGGGSGSGGY